MISDERFELVQLKTGFMSLRSLQNLETFHPVAGPTREAQVLHVDQQRLVGRALELPHLKESAPFVIWDVGLGAGANAITILNQFLNDPQIGTKKPRVEIVSFDQTLGPLKFAIENAEALKYPIGFESILSELMQKLSVQVAPGLRWSFRPGNFTQVVQSIKNEPPHAIIYDPYSPLKNPEMWTLEHFQTLYSKLDPSQPCLWTNYTRSTAVRVGLLLAGFYVGVGKFVGEKAETTVASNCLTLLERPLDSLWLKRVLKSRHSSPLRAADLSKNLNRDYQVMSTQEDPISEADFLRLQSLPQFSS